MCKYISVFISIIETSVYIDFILYSLPVNSVQELQTYTRSTEFELSKHNPNASLLWDHVSSVFKLFNDDW